MPDSKPVEFTEDRIPVDGIGETIAELVEMYGGEMKATGETRSEFVLPLRRGVAAGGGIHCSVTWAGDADREGTVTLVCDRDVDAPRGQRIAMLAAGVIGSLLFLMWPFFPHQREIGTLAWMGGIVALAVYFLSLRRTSGGIAFDFLQRLAERQRSAVTVSEE